MKILIWMLLVPGLVFVLLFLRGAGAANRKWDEDARRDLADNRPQMK